EGNPLCGGQHLHRRRDLLVRLAAQQLPLRAGFCACHLHRLCFRVRVIGDGVVAGDLLLFEHVQTAVHGDTVDPGGELRTCLEPVEALIGAQESFLHHLVCVFLVSSHTVCQVEDAAGMCVHQHAKRIAVAGQHLRYCRCICPFHSLV